MIYYEKTKPVAGTELDRSVFRLKQLQVNEDQFKDFYTFCDIDEVIYSEPRNQKLTTVFPNETLRVEGTENDSKLNAITESFIVTAEQFNIAFPLKTIGELYHAGKRVFFAMIGFYEYTHLVWVAHQIVENCENMFPLESLPTATKNHLFQTAYAVANDRYIQQPNAPFSAYWNEAQTLMEQR